MRPSPRSPSLLPASLTLTLLLAVPALHAQSQAGDQPRGQFGEELEVSEVLLDVLVTDGRGNVVLGLGPDDFVVEEDGETRQVTGVSFYSNRRVAGPLPEALEGEIAVDTLPEDRYFILFFEDQRQRQFETSVPILRQQLDAGRFAKEWARQELLPNDWVAVVSYDHRLKIQTDFTRDREQLVRAIDDAVQGKDLGLNWPSRIALQEGPSLVEDLPYGKDLRKESRRIYDAVELVARATGDIRARKNLVMFGTGFGLLTTLDREDVRYYPPMMQALNDHNVAAYMVDLTPPDTTHAMSDPMNRLAEETGGEYFFNIVNFRTPLEQISDENNGYYLISYRSAHPRGESGYQRVRVRTTNPQFEVKTRDGYRYGDEGARGARRVELPGPGTRAD